MCSLHSKTLLTVILHSFYFLACGDARLATGQQSDWEQMKRIQPRGYVCGIASVPIVIDGKLDDEAWRSAPWTEDFVDIEGERKPLPKLRSRAKMLWDNKNFYIAAELLEPHLQGTITQHDAVLFQDNDFEVFIDPNSDNHEYFELELNALNTTWDLFMKRPYKDSSGADNSWEFVGLKSAVQLHGTLNDPSDMDTSWSLEIAIPWTAFSIPSRTVAVPRHGDKWRVDFSRVEWQFEVEDGKYKKAPNTKEDNWVWSPQGIIDMHRPERWGFVQFSGELPGTTAFENDASLAVRDLLMETYHRQRTFHDKNGKWARSFSELDFPSTSVAQMDTFTMCATLNGYQASAVVKGDKSQELWNVRQDSKIWKSAESNLVDPALKRSGANRLQLRRALDRCPIQNREGLEFLISNMPDRDLRSLTSEFLLEEVHLAYLAWENSPWKNDIPKEIFLNNVLPYANINERRDSWRKDFNERFSPLVEGAATPAVAAARLNQKLFPLVNVRYSTQRPKADQSPYESIKSSTASCTGLSVLLIDACRALGIPARFVGTPLWSDSSGNHSWVEVWDHGWHFTGAAEPSGDRLDQAWFIDRASKAKRNNEMNAIYAVSFQKTPIHFPLVWDRSIDYISAVNVTDRYVDRAAKSPEGSTLIMFQVLDRTSGNRLSTTIRIFDEENLIFEGNSKDERFDANDHLCVYLPKGKAYQLEVGDGAGIKKSHLVSEQHDAPITVFIDVAANSLVPSESSNAIAALVKFLSQTEEQRPAIAEQAFAINPISKADVVEATMLLWDDHVKRIRKTREEEISARMLTLDELKMPFTYEVFGEKSATGRSMFISMHGGGGAPSKVNDQQWENQKKLYRLEEGIYVVPRAPTDTWDLWHQSHIDRLFDRLIEDLIVFEDVDPNRIYLMGYSAGGDGVYQLAPRMADRWAAASMMAGHPNETSPLGLRNLPFTLHMGEKDAAYNRNKTASDWEKKLDDLQRNDPEGYTHLVKIHPGKGHWMDREDAVAIPWMAKMNRNPIPSRIVWKQDDVVENRFYWIAIQPKDIRDRAKITASRTNNIIEIQTEDADRVTIRLNEEMFDLEKPISIRCGSELVFDAVVPRTIRSIAVTLAERGDPKAIYCAEVTVEIPKALP